MSTFEVIRGAEGHCLVLDGTRIAGPKPWGGGRIIHEWRTEETYADAATAGAGTCRWRYEPTDDGDEYDHMWVTSCGWEWDAEGTDEMDENGLFYCPRCGGRIEVVPDGR